MQRTRTPYVPNRFRPRQSVEPANLSLEMMERRLIEEALERYNGNRRVAARALKISERTLYRKIKEYGLGRKAVRRRKKEEEEGRRESERRSG